MTPSSRRIPFARAILIAGIGVCLGGLTAETASAACGDYLLHAKMTSRPIAADSSTAKTPSNGRHEMPTPTQSHDDSTPPARPCSGPNCGRGTDDSIPFAPAQTSSPNTQGEHGLSFVAVMMSGRDSRTLIASSHRLRDSGPRCRVERPPRTAA